MVALTWARHAFTAIRCAQKIPSATRFPGLSWTRNRAVRDVHRREGLHSRRDPVRAVPTPVENGP